MPVTKGTWTEILFHIGWSPGDDAFVSLWVNGEPIVARINDTDLVLTDGEAKAFGPNMYNQAPHYLKLGIYRNPNFTSTNSVYFDDAWISPTKPEGL